MTLAWHPALRRDAQQAARDMHWVAPVEPEVAIAVACRHYGVTARAMRSHRRGDHLVHARAFAVWMLRSFGRPMSYPAIGEQLDRHHSAVISLHMMAVRLRLEDLWFAAACCGVIDHYLSAQEVSHACH